VAGIPPSFVELLERAVTAAGSYQPATTADQEQLRTLASQCEAIFVREDSLAESTACVIETEENCRRG